MKKTLKDTGVREKGNEKIDYFEVMRASEPIESYGIKVLHRRIEEARKEKSRASKSKD